LLTFRQKNNQKKTRKIFSTFKDDKGQAAVEFAFVLVILVPLILWSFQFFDLLQTRLHVIEAARFAGWEETVNNSLTAPDIKSRFFSGTNDIINCPPKRDESSITIAGGQLGEVVFDYLKLNPNGKITQTIENTHDVSIVPGFPPITITATHVMLVDPWKAQNYHDVEKVVRRMWMGGIADITRITKLTDMVNFELIHIDENLTPPH